MMQYIKKHLGKHYLTFCSWSKGLAIICGYNIRQWKTLKNYVETKHLWERIAYLHLKLFSLRQNLQDVWNIATHGTYGNQNCRFVSTQKKSNLKIYVSKSSFILQKINMLVWACVLVVVFSVSKQLRVLKAVCVYADLEQWFGIPNLKVKGLALTMLQYLMAKIFQGNHNHK